MIFINRRQNNNNSKERHQSQSQTVHMLSMNGGTSTLLSKTVNTPFVQPHVKEMLWGEPTWFLFHTLAEKVRPECFSDVRIGLLTFIRRICNNLPCPECTQHATRHINSINFATICSKDDLQLMLFEFHNKVNRRKNYAVFSFNDLHKKYNCANTINIVRNFFHHFSKRHYSVRMGVEGYHRNKMLDDFKAWLETNHNCFDS